jgi:hypothetical protein
MTGNTGGGVLFARFIGTPRGEETYSRIFTAQVGFTLRSVTQGKVLTTLFCVFSFGRAQKRVAQQRIDSKMDLGRVVDIRKNVFAQVKVGGVAFLSPFQSLYHLLTEIHQSWVSDRG